MPDKEKKSEFVVTDRRLFSTDGELRQDVVEDEERRAEREREKHEAQQRVNAERSAQNHAPSSSPIVSPEGPEPEAPSAADQQASANAYKESTRQIDDQLNKQMRRQGQEGRAQDYEMTFEKFVASLYMSALMQLGLAAPQGEKPMVDLLGARQTIDTLAILQEKTKGNLTPAEQNMLQNCLYELRMAYLEVTNLIARPPQAGPGADIKAG